MFFPGSKACDLIVSVLQLPLRRLKRQPYIYFFAALFVKALLQKKRKKEMKHDNDGSQ